MVLADLGRKITTALQSLSRATIINEEVSFTIIGKYISGLSTSRTTLHLCDCIRHTGSKFYAERDMRSPTGSRCEYSFGKEPPRECTCRYRL